MKRILSILFFVFALLQVNAQQPILRNQFTTNVVGQPILGNVRFNGDLRIDGANGITMGANDANILPYGVNGYGVYDFSSMDWAWWTVDDGIFVNHATVGTTIYMNIDGTMYASSNISGADAVQLTNLVTLSQLQAYTIGSETFYPYVRSNIFGLATLSGTIRYTNWAYPTYTSSETSNQVATVANNDYVFAWISSESYYTFPGGAVEVQVWAERDAGIAMSLAAEAYIVRASDTNEIYEFTPAPAAQAIAAGTAAPTKYIYSIPVNGYSSNILMRVMIKGKATTAGSPTFRVYTGGRYPSLFSFSQPGSTYVKKTGDTMTGGLGITGTTTPLFYASNTESGAYFGMSNGSFSILTTNRANAPAAFLVNTNLIVTNNMVGINKIPDSQLSVRGTINATDNITVASAYDINSTRIGTYSADLILTAGYGMGIPNTIFKQGSAELMRLYTNCFLGIGTNAPKAAVHVFSVSNNLIKISSPYQADHLLIETNGTTTLNGSLQLNGSATVTSNIFYGTNAFADASAADMNLGLAVSNLSANVSITGFANAPAGKEATKVFYFLGHTDNSYTVTVPDSVMTTDGLRVWTVTNDTRGVLSVSVISGVVTNGSFVHLW